MKYQKYLTVLQMAIGVTPSNRGSLLPLKRKLWVTPSSENPHGATSTVSQGKPSLRRIKGRLHRSKSLDSIDFCELTVSGLAMLFLSLKKYENVIIVFFLQMQQTCSVVIYSLNSIAARLPMKMLS